MQEDDATHTARLRGDLLAYDYTSDLKPVYYKNVVQKISTPKLVKDRRNVCHSIKEMKKWWPATSHSTTDTDE